MSEYSLVRVFVPWSQRLYFFWYHLFLFENLRREALIEPPSWEKRKPLVKIVENLTFTLAQHLTAVKEVIFFWPITSLKIFNPSNHITHRAIKNILQSEAMVKSWWHESEDPNGLDQRLSFLGSQRFVPIKKYKKRFASQNLPRENKRSPSRTWVV